MSIPEPIFGGYLPKVIYPLEWDRLIHVASVSGCLSDGPSPIEGRLAYWQFNRARFYHTEEMARAVLPTEEDADRGDSWVHNAVCGEDPAVAMFGYWIYPLLFDQPDGPRRIDLNAMFDPNIAPLPAEPPIPAWKVLGYDAVAFENDHGCWGCSPLTCNGYVTDEDGPRPVNRYGLLRTPEAAFEAARLFQAEQPEPGTYLVFRVEVPPDSPLLSLEPGKATARPP
ncbi:hypothetical protein EON79_14915 [bacterium]|nr:MAG: hypothetical protein EON79_14915 [bacterium]